MGVLMRRVLHDLGVFDLPVARPFRVKRQRVIREGELERSIVQAERSRSGASSVFIVLDADEDCPADLASHLMQRARVQTDLPVRVVFPKVEIEAWILGAVDSLRGVRGIRDDAQPLVASAVANGIFDVGWILAHDCLNEPRQERGRTGPVADVEGRQLRVQKLKIRGVAARHGRILRLSLASVRVRRQREREPHLGPPPLSGGDAEHEIARQGWFGAKRGPAAGGGRRRTRYRNEMG